MNPDDNEQLLQKLYTKVELLIYRTERLEQEHQELFSYIKKLIWLIISILIAGIMAFMLNGGLNVVN